MTNPGDDLGDRVDRILAREIPCYESLVSIQRLTGGANQETYRVDVLAAEKRQTLALRRAAGGTVEPESPENIGLANEARVMRAAATSGVPVPKVTYVLAESDGLGAGFFMDWIDGETRGARIVRDESFAELRGHLAFRCGEILARIHAIDYRGTGLEQYLPHKTPEQFIRQTWQRYQDLNTPQPMIDYTAVWLLEHQPTESRTALVHNDFRNGNLMVSPQDVVAVLDWEIAHIGDPCRDLGWICTNSWRFGRRDLPVGGFGKYADLLAGYQSVSGIEVDRDAVHYWEVFGSFWWAVGCLIMADHYRHGPDPSVERPAIGRRSSECQMDCVHLLIPGPVTISTPRPADSDELPSGDELLDSVAKFLRDDVMVQTEGRVKFLARVAANSLDIVLRERSLKEANDALELARLHGLFASNDSLRALRWRLVEAIRGQDFKLNDPKLVEHLRLTVFNQLAVDQPNYSAFRAADIN